MRVKKAGGKVYGADFTAAERKAEYFDLVKRYEMDEADNVWLNTRKLKEIGVDIESWNKGGEG